MLYNDVADTDSVGPILSSARTSSSWGITMEEEVVEVDDVVIAELLVELLRKCA